ncbi:gem-associated protein 5 [Pogonomyrmex barbatus]|uniref:Gem-associated protein 5 n=1 Tax=Pogonomyrmex barbatus TaxID=144034 RepID=A0A6I9WXZ5_9HYME|nr:gem-associated protein 5 [Pogonomyrmex barbatus]
MNEVKLPPSPNWYLNNILACSKRGTVAWGTKNCIVIARQKEGNNAMQYSIIKDQFRDKVTAVAFCPKFESLDSPELLIFCGDDVKVKVWNVDTLEPVDEFSFADGVKLVVGVDWSVKDSNIACAVSSEGILMYCNIQYNTSKLVPLGKLTATCLACCPHDSNLVAIGTKTGLIFIVQKEVILYKMRGHNEEIVSLSWCPSDMNVLAKENTRDLLLASGAKDRSIFIWRAGRDGRYEIQLNLPHLPLTGSYQNKSKLSAATGAWIAVCWAEPKVLLTSSLWGELLSWDLSTNKEKPLYKLLHTFHNRGLFCIASVPNNDEDEDDLTKESENWRTDSELRVWTLAQDRWIICCKRDSDPTKSVILEHKIPTQGGFVYCMSACPIDTSRIAFGAGDTMLRLWNLSEPHTTTFDIITHWQKIKGKIRAISWFPYDETTIAFGTGEGRVGVFEAIGTNKPPILYRQYHRHTIYKIEWAKFESENYLFSCAEGELIAYKKSAPNDEPMSIIKKGCMEFSWKSNLCLAVAFENGSLAFFDQKLRKRGNSIHILRTTVNCLVWHPESTTAERWTSPYANYLAVASDSCDIIIFDLSKLIIELEKTGTKDLIENEDKEQEKDRTSHKIVATLTGHSDRVVCLAWNPHFSGLLVSGSYDNTAQIWNVEKQELIATYMGHDGPVLCCMWSPIKPQFIMTGSMDFMLHIWDYTSSEQSPKQPSEVKVIKKKHKQKRLLKNKTDDCENDLTTLTDSTNQASSAKEKRKKSYFNKYNRIINDKSVILNFIKNDIRNNQKQSKENTESETNFSLFCEQKDDLLTLISNEKLTQDNAETNIEIDMWCNNLEENLISAVKNHQLNDFLISLAPHVSIKTWREMCEAYAHQLVEQNNPGKAVAYLLSIHKIYDAIEVFLNAKLFKEAYAVARCKLDTDDPFLKKILEQWAEWTVSKGHLEQAAHCYVKLNDYEKAANVLSRRKDIYCLEIASELAFLSGDEGHGKSLAVDAMTRALIKSEWSKARSLITDIRQVQYLNVNIDAHEIIMSTYLKETELDVIKIWLKEKENNGLIQTLEEKYDTSYYDILLKNESNNIVLKNITNEEMMQIKICYQIALAATCDAKEIRLKHITRALNNIIEYEKAVAKYGIPKEGFFMHVLTKLDTRKPTNKDSIYAKSSYPVSQSLRACLCVGLLNWLLKYLVKLSVEEETQIMQLIIDLMDDAINKTNLDYQIKLLKYEKLENELMILKLEKGNETENHNYQTIEEEAEILKIYVNKFCEDRIFIPDPFDIFQKTCSLVKKLQEKNQFLFLACLNKLVEETKITQIGIEASLLKQKNLTISDTDLNLSSSSNSSSN